MPSLGPPSLGAPSLGPPSLGAPSLGPPSLGPPSLSPPGAGPAHPPPPPRPAGGLKIKIGGLGGPRLSALISPPSGGGGGGAGGAGGGRGKPPPAKRARPAPPPAGPSLAHQAPAPPGPPPPPRRPPIPPAVARKALCNRVLAPALAAAKRKLAHHTITPFRKPVPKASAPDYAAIVPAAETMDLDRIERNIKHGRYGSGAALREDVAKIVRAATLYNGLDPATGRARGRFGGEAVIPLAQAVADAIYSELDERAAALASAEAAVGAEAAARAAAKAAAGGGGGLLFPPGAAAAAGPPDVDPAAPPPPTELWVQCTNCKKWRNISPALHARTVDAAKPDAPWFCGFDTERPGGGNCDRPCDYELSKRMGLFVEGEDGEGDEPGGVGGGAE